MKILLTGWALLLSSALFAQDEYHTFIQQTLNNQYGLTGGNWVFFDNEVQNLEEASYSYGTVDLIQLTSTTESFSQITNILNEVEGEYSYSSSWGMSNQNTILENDVCLLVVNIRKTDNPYLNDLGKVTLYLQAGDNSVFEESLVVQLENQWNQYLIPFQADKTYLFDEFVAGLHVAWEVQEIEVAGMNILNFGNNYTLDEMPFVAHNERYGGYEANAPWRAAAQNRIEASRKADLTVEVNDNNGNLISNATVAVQMLEHEFNWGTAIGLDRIAGNIRQEDEYENKLLDIDGEGHRLSWVAPENSFKWPGWEENWMTSPGEKINAAQWLKANDFKVRFHTLVWPGWLPSPVDIEPNANNPQYIIDRVSNWIDFIVTNPGLQNVFDEYDVINELVAYQDYQNALAGYGNYVTGREFYVEVMSQLSQLEPNKAQVINDYATITQHQTSGAEYDFLQSALQEVIDGGGDLGGIGFQSHIGYFPTSIYDVEEILTDFASKFNVPLKVTEYDFPDARIDEQVAAQYLEDFITMLFSIPQADMFIFWGMWDVEHQTGNGNLFNSDWSEKPSAQVFFNKVFNEWWTEEQLTTNQNGEASFRAYKGRHEITIEYNNEIIIDTITLEAPQMLTYTLNNTQNCAPNLNLSGNIASGIYRAGNQLNSTAIINTNRSVQYKAGQRIKLNNNTRIKAGSTFNADIEGCTE